MDTLVGTSISGYTLVKLLGAGGMGSVYLANDPAIGQQVAVKVIRTDLDAYIDSASAQKALERFKQEARAVASLDHLHILPLYRYGEDETPQGLRAYMIMQYRPEGSLWDWLRRRAEFAGGQLQPTQTELSSGLPLNWPMGLDEVAEYLRQAAEALQYAHDHNPGIVHRDVKPANFLLRIDLHNKNVHLLLSDFGLAKAFTSSSATNTILGTPTYMAPEQFEGLARPESDQYALAVMVYYLLAGRAPFEGDPLQLMRQHLAADVPPVTQFNSNVPSAINGVLAHALAKLPEQRFPSIAAFAETFIRVAKQPQPFLATQGTAFSGGSPTLPSTHPAGRVSPGPLVLPGVPEPAAGMGMYTNGTAAAPTVYPTYSPDPKLASGMYNVQAPFVNTHPQQAPAFSPAPVPGGYQPQTDPRQGGQKVKRRGALGWILGATALVAVGAGAGAYLYLNNSAQPGANSSLNSPSGTANQSSTPGSQSNTPVNQSHPALSILKGHTGAVTSLSWLPGSAQLASGSVDASVRLWSASDGSSIQRINTASPVHALAWSPDGNALAAGLEDHSVRLLQASGSLIKREASWGAPIYGLAWQSNILLFLGTYGDGLHALNTTNYKHSGKYALLARITAIALSPDGNSLGVTLADGQVIFLSVANNLTLVDTIPASHGEALSISWSPDNSLIAVGYDDNYAVVYDTSTRQELFDLKHTGPVYSVAWSPNSASTPVLASGSGGDNTVNIWNLGPNKNQIIYSGHTDAVLAVAWGDNLLASASKDQTVILWQPPNG